MTQITPDSKIEIAGKSYTLDGSLSTLKDAQNLVGDDIYAYLFSRAARATFNQCAALFYMGINNAGDTPPELETIEQYIVDDKGINWARQQLFLWLEVASTPKRDREKKRAKLVAELEQLNNLLSHGQNTGDSPSGTSAGAPQTSGAPPSGT